MNPSDHILLCSDCGTINPYAMGSQYRNMPEAVANDHVAKNPGHVVALYRFVGVTGRPGEWTR